MKKQLSRHSQIIIFASSLSISLILSNIPTHALTVQEVPNPRQQNSGWVTDMVDMLSPEAEAQINQMISNLEQENGTEITVVTVPTTKPSSTPKAFTTELFNTWGIGKKGKDNGILFLVSKGDRRTEIETGYGVEEILPDALVGSIIRKQVTPKFKKGKFEAGILAGTKSLIKELETKTTQTQNAVSSETEHPDFVIFLVLLPMFLLMIIAFLLSLLPVLLPISIFIIIIIMLLEWRGIIKTNLNSFMLKKLRNYSNNYSGSSYSSSSSSSYSSSSSSDYSSSSSSDYSSSSDSSDFGGGDSGGAGAGDDW
ncbi:MAG: TPM domain-containing protein [Mastigocoleus sp. MO_167.B18]|nr:TPM domain-containing protein [Mastigocoleus sp. MO_167.B18]